MHPTPSPPSLTTSLRPPFSSWSCRNTPNRVNTGNKTRQYLCDFGCVGLCWWESVSALAVCIQVLHVCCVILLVVTMFSRVSFSSITRQMSTLTSLRWNELPHLQHSANNSLCKSHHLIRAQKIMSQSI